MQKCDSSTEAGTTVTRGRGRPRAFDRDAALAKATRLFWEKGYGATSISDLTEAMGIGSPSLYAAFRSKEALYTEALRHYRESTEATVWSGFFAARTAREAVISFLSDTAEGLTDRLADAPRGCMVTLSSVGGEGHRELGELVRSARRMTLERLTGRLQQAVAGGEIAPSTDLRALARFVQTVQSGMSVLARDGAERSELQAVAQLAILGWDARVGAA